MCSCPGACAVEGLCGSSFDGTGGGVDRVFGHASAETVGGVAIASVWFIGGGKADGLFTGGVEEVMNEECSLTPLCSTPSLPAWGVVTHPGYFSYMGFAVGILYGKYPKD